ncbi:MAG: hypothetical protein AAF907_12905, partial [Planctomycetota bacterium]
DELEALKRALDLTAEAQSMALIAVRPLREKPDRDQVAVYKTIRDVSDANTGIQYFIRNYLRVGSHADPAGFADLAARIEAAANRRTRGKSEREAFKKLAHAAAKVAEHAGDTDSDRFDYHADRLADFAERLLTMGVSPGDRRFREASPDEPCAFRLALDRRNENDPAAEHGAAATLRAIVESLPERADESEKAEKEDEPPTHEYADTVDAAIARIREEHPQALAFAFNSHSVAEGDPYRWPDRVYLGLRFLATTLRDALSGESPREDLEAECRRQCGLQYAANSVPGTIGQFPANSRTIWEGEEVKLPRSLSRGTDADPRRSIRIAFHYDQQANVIVIGYLGPHQLVRAK